MHCKDQSGVKDIQNFVINEWPSLIKKNSLLRRTYLFENRRSGYRSSTSYVKLRNGIEMFRQNKIDISITMHATFTLRHYVDIMHLIPWLWKRY